MKESKKGLRPAKPADSSPSGGPAENDAAKPLTTSKSRRKFLGQAAGTAAAVAVSDLALGTKKAAAAPDTPNGTWAPIPQEELLARRQSVYAFQGKRAKKYRDLVFQLQLANDDELIYDEKFASSTRALPHDDLGHVDMDAWKTFVDACQSGDPEDFKKIPLGGTQPLRNPQSGFAFDMAGYDSQQTIMPPANPFNSAIRAAEAVELYWASLLRDVPFRDWDSDPTVAAACAELTKLEGYQGPKERGRVTPNTLLRGPYEGCTTGPAISQFLLKDLRYGSQFIFQRQRTLATGNDYLGDYADWLARQNGQTWGPRIFDPTLRYIRSLRDIAAWVDTDPPSQAGEYALMLLLNQNSRVDFNNPYFGGGITNQDAFTTFGPVEWFDLVGRAPRAAHMACWFQKWLIHRTLRPEEFGGRVHNHLTGAFSYPLHADVLNSKAVQQSFSKFGTYLLTTAYPDGAPVHCSYPSGHSVGSGANATMCKAMFDETDFVREPVEPNSGGTALVPYEGPPLTLRGELNKLAWNIGLGRMAAGIHYRQDVVQGNILGEQTTIGLLREMKDACNEPYAGYTLRDFKGKTIQI